MALIKLNNQSYTSGSAFLPTGSILQEVHTTDNPATGSTTSTSFVDTNLSLSITPTVIGSKILVIANQHIAIQAGTSNARCNIQLYVNADSADTNICTSDYYGQDGATPTRIIHRIVLQDTYTTLSTSSHTFKVRIRKAAGDANEAGTISYNGYAGNWSDHMQLIEFLN